MERLVYTYTLLKSLYDLGEDYIDSFWPFAIKVVPTDGKFVDLNFIQRSLKGIFGLEAPLNSIGFILNRAQKRGYIEQKEKKYKLTEAGLKYLDTFETDKDVERRLNSLFDDIKQFLSESGVPITTDQIHDTLFSLVYKNTDVLMEFFIPSTKISGQLVIPKVSSFDKCLIEYIETAEQRKPEHYKALQDIVFGSIISTVLSSEEPSAMIEITKRKFKHCQAFLDTNFIFSILGLHTPEFNDPAKELFELLKKWGLELKVFSFTVDEICNVINGYPGQAYRYPTSIRVDTFYSSLKSKGWTKTKTKEFITNIEGTLSTSGIQIEWVRDVDLKNYKLPSDELRNVIGKYKPDQDLFYQNHDLAAIEKIKELRRRPVRKIEDSGVLFLTSDKRLSRFNFIEMGHRESVTLPHY